MKTLWCLTCSAMNGTVTMSTEVTLYPTKELAEEVEKKVKDIYEESSDKFFGLLTDIEEVYMYETLDEVPIVKNQK